MNSSSEKRLLPLLLDHISLDSFVILLSSLVFVAALLLVLFFQTDGLFSEGSANFIFKGGTRCQKNPLPSSL